MAQFRFSWADLLALLAIIAFGCFCFLSFNFLYLGETGPSIGWASVIAVLLGGIAFVLRLLKRTSRYFRTCFILELILLFLFVVAAFIAVFPFSHYFAVSDQKEEIQAKITSEILQAEKMFSGYEAYSNNRGNNYEGDLESAVSGKWVSPRVYYDEYGFVNGIADGEQIDNKMFTLHTILFPSNFSEMRQVDSLWLVKARNTIDNWKSIGIVEVVNDVKKTTEKWLDSLKQFSVYRAEGEIADNFDYPLTFDNVTAKFTTLGEPTTISISVAIALFLIMLLPYFISKRSTKTSVCRNRKEGKYRIPY